MLAFETFFIVVICLVLDEFLFAIHPEITVVALSNHPELNENLPSHKQ